MRTELNFLELHFLVGELQVLVGSRLDNVYDGLLQFHKSGVGKFFLRISDKALWLSKKSFVECSGLCSVLRKFLKGKKMVALEQIGSERVVRFTFQTQKEIFLLFAEFFSNGNLILTDESKKILGAKEERAWKDREIRRGKIYVLPPARQNLFEIKVIPSDEKSLAALGFGRLLAKEIVARGGNLDAYKSILREKPCAFLYDGEMSPFRLVQFAEGQSFAN